MLTKEMVRELQPRDKPYRKHDSGGLSLLISPNGSKGWRFSYRYRGREKMLSFGPAQYVSLANARKQRDAARALLKMGIDPSMARREVKAAGLDEAEVRAAVKRLIASA